MRVAKTNHDEIGSLFSFLSELSSFHKYYRNTDLQDIDWDEFGILSKFDRSSYESFFNALLQYVHEIHFERILTNCAVLLDNCADPNLDYLDFNENIKKALELLESNKNGTT